MTYGAWIKPDGKVIDCPDKLSHTQYCDYTAADDEGWIGVVYGYGCFAVQENKHFGDCFRLSKDNVTIKAINKAMRLIRQSTEEVFFLSDSFTNSFAGLSQGMNAAKALQFFGQLKFEKQEQDE